MVTQNSRWDEPASRPMPVEPFTISVADEVLADLRTRLENTRWPDPAPGPAWEQGTDLGYLSAAGRLLALRFRLARARA